jgi:type I restriction enzyme S subunit
MSDGATLPPGWAWAPLSEVCEKIQDGTHFSPKNQLPEGRYRYITAKNVKPSGLDLSDVTYLTEEDHREIYQRCDVHPGDVLLVKDGVNTGDAAINTLEEEISLLSSVCMLRPHESLLGNQYLRYYLLSPTGASFLTGKMTGTAIRRIILKRIKETPIPLAPVNEQARIVERLEELLSDLDAGVSALERAKANLKRYRAAVLRAAVTGELTAEWRAAHLNVEPATKLLDRILAERRRKWETDQQAKFGKTAKTARKNWKSKNQEPATPDAGGFPQLPTGWCWATLEQLNRVERPMSYGVLQPGPDIVDGVPLIRVCDIADGKVDETQLKRIKSTISANYQRTILEGGEVLLTIVGTIGRTAVAPACLKGANTARAVAVIPVVDLITPQYVEIVLRESGMRKRLTETAHEVARKTLNLEDVRRACVPLAPVAEQAVIIEEIEQRLSVITAAENYIAASLKRAARLRQSILKEAFAGRLVPQDPNDEPADRLLERIRRERELRTMQEGRNGSARRTRGRGKRSSPKRV